MPARTPAPFDLESLNTALPKIFDQAQNTAANHQKNFIALYKLQSDAAAITQSVQNRKGSKLVGEKAFEGAFQDMVLRVLPIKKGTSVADRSIKFMAGYAKFITEKNLQERQKDGVDEDDDTTTERFLSHLLRFLLDGCVAKDKIVRFRVCQCIADTINYFGSIDEDLYAHLRATLLERLRDKEANIRAQAAIALSKLSFTEDPSEVDEDETTILAAVLDAMAYDPSPDVRRAVLQNLPLGPQTLPPLLERSRDVDPNIRKLVYTYVLEKYCQPSDFGQVGFTHPRALSIAQREMIVRNGLGDREGSVKTAAAQLLGQWVDVVRSDGSKKEEGVKKEVGEETIEDLVAFLKLFDLTEGTVAEDALGSVLNTRVDIYEHLEFPEDYWTTLTPERAFLIRVFVDKCIEKDRTREKADGILPVTTALAFRIQDAYNVLADQIQEDEALLKDPEFLEDEEARVHREEARLDMELTIGELVRLAKHADFQDEIGRRKMFQLVRGMLAQTILPESLIPCALDVLRVLAADEKDLIRLVVEVVHELRDPADEEPDGKADASADPDESMTEFGSPRKAPRVPQLPKPVAEMTAEERLRMDEIDLRCLSLCIGMLERVNGTFEDNSTLEGILGELIIPAVKRHTMSLREKGLISLGLCCLIARRMALSSFQLFIGQVATAPELIKVRVLQIMFDILMVHEGAFLGADSTNGQKIIEFLLQLLETEESDRVQALLCMGLAKLMLAGMVADEQALSTLVLMYISPETAKNQELRQCLSYFFPVYSYSTRANQDRMRKIFVPLFDQLTKAYHEWDGEDDMVIPTRVALMFVDWTDPFRAQEATKGQRKEPEKDPIHLDLATDIVKALFSADYEKEDRKALCQMLGKLQLPDEVDDDKVRILKLLVMNLRSRRPPRDTSAKNAVSKFETSLSKKYEKQLENFSEEEFRKLEELKGLFEFLDDIIPLEEDEDELPRKCRKRRSMSVATETTTTSAASSMDRTPSPRGKGRAKRRRLSQSDDESDDDDDDRTVHSRASPDATPVPTRAMPKRGAAERSKKKISEAFEPIEISSDEEEEEDEGGDNDDSDGDEYRKRRAGQTMSKPKSKCKSEAKSRAAESGEEDDDGDGDGDDDDGATEREEDNEATPVAKPRANVKRGPPPRAAKAGPGSKPKTKAKTKPARAKVQPKAASSRARKVVEAKIDEDIDDMLEDRVEEEEEEEEEETDDPHAHAGNATKDSIMDSSEDEEEDEVANIL